jgi:pimeloyl-ACP methyl ester carboxylesterase
MNDSETPRAALGVSAQHRTVSVCGVSLAYDDEGQGEPLLCVHAIGHGSADSAGLRARWREGYRVIAFDWPGHGRSGADSVPPSGERFAEVLEGFCAALDLPPVILVANSIGGNAAVRFAARRPERVRALVLSNPGGLVRDGFAKRVFTRWIARRFAGASAHPERFRRFYHKLYRRLLATPAADAQRERILATGMDAAPMLAAAWRSFGERGDGLWEVAPRVACPTLVTWSVADPLNRLFLNRPGIRRLPRARLVTFAGGHTPYLEEPEAFADAFTGFLGELP